MLHNLVKISNGRDSNLSKEKCKPFKINGSFRQGPKLMKIQEIDYENKLLAQRIMNQKSVISKNKIKKDIEEYNRIK